MIELRAAVMLIASVSATVFPDSCTVTSVTLKVPERGAMAASPPASSRPSGDAVFSGVTGWAKCSPYRAFDPGSLSGFQFRSGTNEVTSFGAGDAAGGDAPAAASDGFTVDGSAAAARFSVAGTVSAGTGASGAVAGSVADSSACRGATVAGDVGAVDGGAGAVDGGAAGTASFAMAGTAPPRSPKDRRAAHRSRAGEGKVTGFSSRIRASAS